MKHTHACTHTTKMNYKVHFNICELNFELVHGESELSQL